MAMPRRSAVNLISPGGTYSCLTGDEGWRSHAESPATCTHEGESRRDGFMVANEHLYRVIWNMLKERQCYLYRINGVEDHIHMVVDVHSSISKAKLIQET